MPSPLLWRAAAATSISGFSIMRSALPSGMCSRTTKLLFQLEYAFTDTSPQFSLQKLWVYVYPIAHTLSHIYQLILELATTDDDNASSSSYSHIVKLQSLLDLAPTGEYSAFHEDVRVSMASSGFYEWLLEVFIVSGVIGGEKGEGVPDEEAKKDRDREKAHD
ncbi:hypothetical protein F4604DRAFT_1936748 [Suillus subluteus]|nr:hypothetical protein F4604DRAFT_1936748 [Suillus subluteus]